MADSPPATAADAPTDRPGPPRPAAISQARCMAGLYDLEGLGAQLRRQADAIGAYRADRPIALTDGGHSPEPMPLRDFPTAERILDFWHAAGHVRELARLYGGPGTPAAAGLARRWCHQMEHEGGAAVPATLRDLAPSGRGGETVEDHRERVQDFEADVHRMDDPRYRRLGWHVGSGGVEEACKTVIGGRWKRRGCVGVRTRPMPPVISGRRS